MRSPLTISMSDLVKFQEDQVSWMEKAFPGMKLTGKISANAADHKLECARTILYLLKKQLRNPQLDMISEIEKMKGR